MRRLVLVGLVLLLLLGIAHVSSSRHPPRSNLVRLLKKAIGSLSKKNHNVNAQNVNVKCPDDVNFENVYDLEELFTLPSSNFLVEAADTMLTGPLPMTSAEVTDAFYLDPMRTQMIETMSASIEPYFMNPATFATAVTMEMYPLFLEGRSKCASTVLNKFSMKLWDVHYREMIAEDVEIYRRFEQAARAVFPMFETMPDELRWFVGNATENMHSTLLNDTTTLTLALELRDVAKAAHILYNELLTMRAQPVQSADTTPFTTLIENTIRDADVRCHTGDEMFNTHSTATYIFLKEYEELEIEHVCYDIGEFVYGYMARRVEGMSGVTLKWLEDNIHWQNLYPVCSWVRDFIHNKIFPSVYYFHHIIDNRLTNEFMEMFYFLAPHEMMVLEDVLVRLGFPPRSPTDASTQSPETPNETPTQPPMTEEPVTNPQAPMTQEPPMDSTMRRQFGGQNNFARVINYNPTAAPRVIQQNMRKRFDGRNKFAQGINYNPTAAPKINFNRYFNGRYPKSKQQDMRRQSGVRNNFVQGINYNPTAAPRNNVVRYFNGRFLKSMGRSDI